MNGKKSNQLENGQIVDEVIGNLNNKTVRISAGALVNMLLSRSGPTYQSRADLYQDLEWAEGAIAAVFGDGVAAYRGVYRKEGQTGGGAWVRISDLPLSGISVAQLAEKADAAALADERAARIAGDNAGTEASYYAGPWDASLGLFPSQRLLGGDVQNGDVFDVSVGGVVDSVTFFPGDRIRALRNAPLAGIYDGQWYHAETPAALAPLKEALDSAPLPVETNAALSSLTYDKAAEGRILSLATGYSYKVVGQTSGNADFDNISNGGIKAVDLQKRTAAAVAALLTLIPNNAVFALDGLNYQKNTEIPVSASATADLGIGQVQPFGDVKPAHYGDDIQRAIANTGSGELFFPSGEFYVPSITLDRNIKIEGAGRFKTTIKFTGETRFDGVDSSLLCLGEPNVGLATQMNINGMTLDFQDAPAGAQGALITRKTDMIEVSLLRADMDGMHFRAINPSTHAPYFCSMDRVWSKLNGRNGIRITDTCNANQFYNNQFDSNGANGWEQILINLPGRNQAIYGNVMYGGQCSYNWLDGYAVQNGTNAQAYNLYAEYNSQVDGGDPRVGARWNVRLGPTVSNCMLFLGVLGTDINPELTVSVPVGTTSNQVWLGGRPLTPSGDLLIGHANSGSERNITMRGEGGVQHRINYEEGADGAVPIRLVYDGTGGASSNIWAVETKLGDDPYQRPLAVRDNGFLGLWGAEPVAQPAAMDDVPFGASATAQDNAAAINSFLARLRNAGIIAT